MVYLLGMARKRKPKVVVSCKVSPALRKRIRRAATDADYPTTSAFVAALIERAMDCLRIKYDG